MDVLINLTMVNILQYVYYNLYINNFYLLTDAFFPYHEAIL